MTSRSLRGLALGTVLLLLVAAPAAAQVKATKSESRPLGGEWYGSLELRHHLNTYYDQDGYYHHQEPSVHARVQVGAQFYQGLVDAYTTLGVYKVPETQQVLQRRPEVAIDIYPVRNEYLQILQYNLAQLPYDETLPDPEADEGEEPKVGTVYTVGLAPTAKLPFMAGSSRVELKTGVDGWTKLYSRRQFTTEYTWADESDESRLGLDEVEPAEGGASEPEPIEDTALHYRTEYMMGAAFQPGFAPGLSTEATANYHTKYEPVYERTGEEGVEYHYTAERHAYYKVRLSYAISERVAVINDFYQFYDGFYAEKRVGDERRFRNIARITCKL